MESLLTVLIPLVGIGGVASFVLYEVLKKKRAKRRRGKARESGISAVGDREFVRILGKATSIVANTAPLTDRPCVYWVLTIREQYRDPDDRLQWGTRDRTAKGTKILITDDDGDVATLDLGLATEVTTEDTGISMGWEPSKERAESGTQPDLKRFLDDTSFRPKAGNAIEISEVIIPEGDLIVAWGLGMREPDPNGAKRATGYRGPPPTRVRLAQGNDDQKLEVSANVAPHLGWDL